MVPKKQTKSTSSWMKIELCFSRVERKGLRRVLWEPVKLLCLCQPLHSPKWPFVRSSVRQSWWEVRLRALGFFWLRFKCVFLGRFPPSLLPDLQPHWFFCLGEHLGSIFWTHFLLGVSSLSSSRAFWENRTEGERWLEDAEWHLIQRRPARPVGDHCPGLSCDTGSSSVWCFVFLSFFFFNFFLTLCELYLDKLQV